MNGIRRRSGGLCSTGLLARQDQLTFSKAARVGNDQRMAGKNRRFLQIHGSLSTWTGPLAEASCARVTGGVWDLALVVAEGLSAIAVERHAEYWIKVRHLSVCWPAFQGAPGDFWGPTRL